MFDKLCVQCGGSARLFTKGLCNRCYGNKHYHKNKDKINARQRARVALIKDEESFKAARRKATREWRERNPEYREYHNRYHLEKKYGLTPGQRGQMIAAQGGVCAICSDILVKPHIDHCHASGLVRGILCPKCNKGLGLFKDSPEVLQRAASYLMKNI